MNAYLFKYRRFDYPGETYEAVECAFTADDALTQFRVNVVEYPANSYLADDRTKRSYITLLGMRTLDPVEYATRRAEELRGG